MAGCCEPRGCEKFFGDAFARRVAKRYRKRGLDKTAGRIVAFLEREGVETATVLEIGGGVGEIQVELLERGAATATGLELSPGYDAEAERLVAEKGLTGRVQRRLLDLAAEPTAVEPADVVVLHRVVCCYPDYERLLGAAADLCRSRLAFSHPPRTVGSRAVVATQNALFALGRKEFRTFAHPPEAMVDVVASRGLKPVFAHPGWVWHVEGLAR